MVARFWKGAALAKYSRNAVKAEADDALIFSFSVVNFCKLRVARILKIGFLIGLIIFCNYNFTRRYLPLATLVNLQSMRIKKKIIVILCNNSILIFYHDFWKKDRKDVKD